MFDKVLTWIATNRMTILPLVAVFDIAAWTALIFFGWHYLNCMV